MAVWRRRAYLACMLHAPPHVRPHTTTGGAWASAIASQQSRSNVRRASEQSARGDLRAVRSILGRRQSEQAVWSSLYRYAWSTCLGNTNKLCYAIEGTKATVMEISFDLRYAVVDDLPLGVSSTTTSPAFVKVHSNHSVRSLKDN